jgi:glyoxylase-like metal-dependent hydrolase (beta-lactamase superfamily II)
MSGPGRTIAAMTGHVTAPAAALADALPDWVTLLRAPNPGPMTLDGTNTWIFRANGQTPGAVIDPGPDDDGHLAAIAHHAPVGWILITHGHPDHVAGAHRLAARLGDPPVLAVDSAHRTGEGLSAGPFAAGGCSVEPLATPGHTADSVCFLVEYGGERVIFTGDTILGRGTTVVAYPDGDLGDYLASLEALSAYEGIRALPGHGPALADCAIAARFYLAHRRARLEQVREAVAAGARSAPDVVATVYADVDRSLWPAAELSVRAQLAYLSRQEPRTTGEGEPAARESPAGAARLDRP